jgi:hypothetical protein
LGAAFGDLNLSYGSRATINVWIDLKNSGLANDARQVPRLPGQVGQSQHRGASCQ